jgi:hypothetical protein
MQEVSEHITVESGQDQVDATTAGILCHSDRITLFSESIDEIYDIS